MKSKGFIFAITTIVLFVFVISGDIYTQSISKDNITKFRKRGLFTITGYVVLYDMTGTGKGKFWNVNIKVIPENRDYYVKKLLVDGVNIPGTGKNQYRTSGGKNKADYYPEKKIFIEVVYSNKRIRSFGDKTEKLAYIALNYLIKYLYPVKGQVVPFGSNGLQLKWKFLRMMKKSDVFIYNMSDSQQGAVNRGTSSNTTYTIPASVLIRGDRYRVRNSIIYGYMKKSIKVTRNSYIDFSYDYLLDFRIR